MGEEKKDRNLEFIRDWKERGLGNEELGTKYGMTPGGVKALKQRLRAKQPSLYEKAPPPGPGPGKAPLRVKDLQPNPFRDIRHYPIDRARVEKLRQSIKDTGFWDNILARAAPKQKGKYEIAYGHHRLIAIREELGDETEIDIPVRDLSDEDMLKIMANENITIFEHSPQVIVETVRQVQRFIEANPALDRELEERPDSGVGKGYAGKASKESLKIFAFLGETWSLRTVINALEVEKAHEAEIERQAPSLRHAAAIARVPEKERKGLTELVKERGLTSQETEALSQVLRDEVLNEVDKKTIRFLVEQGEIRGREQIKRTHERYKDRRLTKPKMSVETEKRTVKIESWLSEIGKSAKHLAGLIERLSAEVASYPEIMEFFPEEETMEASSGMGDLSLAITEFKLTCQTARSKLKNLPKNK